MRKRTRPEIKAYVQVIVTVAAGLCIANLAFTQDSREDAYQDHLDKVRRLLPPHSALPPLLDLSKPNPNEEGANRAWENYFTGSMGVREHLDPGIAEAGLGSISTTTTDYAGPMLPLTARSCDVVIAKPCCEADSFQRSYGIQSPLCLFHVYAGDIRGA